MKVRNVETGEVAELRDLIEEAITPDYYMDMLDDCYPTVEIMGREYLQGTLYRELQPLDFKLDYDSYIDEVEAEQEKDLENYGEIEFEGETYEAYWESGGEIPTSILPHY